MTRWRTSVAIAMAAVLVLPVPLQAAGGGGGGGGGGMSPSQSEPQYDPATEYSNGVTAFNAQDYKKAVIAFDRVITALPSFAPARYMQGASYMNLGNYKKARRALDAAVKADPKMIDGWRDLAITYAMLGDAAKSATARDTLVQRKTECAGTCSDAAALDAALAKIDAAAAGKVQAAGPDHPLRSVASIDAVYVSAVSLINHHRYDEAIGQLEDAVWSAGPHPDITTYLGFANRKLGRYETARRWYEAALTVAPRHRGALEYYGELKLELGDTAGARQHLARLDQLCAFGCQQADELRRWIRESARSAS